MASQLVFKTSLSKRSKSHQASRTSWRSTREVLGRSSTAASLENSKVSPESQWKRVLRVKSTRNSMMQETSLVIWRLMVSFPQTDSEIWFWQGRKAAILTYRRSWRASVNRTLKVVGYPLASIEGLCLILRRMTLVPSQKVSSSLRIYAALTPKNSISTLWAAVKV